ncbi:MAG: restriction endonuclease [Deltaproteobacteria bacterium]|nr:restriction endonuclease [Deltaproteobacteria bacterium]
MLIIDELTHLGWSDRIKVSTKTNITVTSQFGDIGLCLQTGNMGRFYADILKLQTLFREDSIKAGIYVIPTKAEAKNIGSNIAHYDRFVEELNVFAKTITIPLIVFGFERG